MKKNARPAEWTLELIDAIEWKRFEELCIRLFEYKGFQCETQNLGSDKGIDIHLYYGKDKLVLDRIVHCKTSRQQVSVDLMDDFFSTMQCRNARRGTYVSRGGFTEDAKIHAEMHGIHTIDNVQVLELINRLDQLESLILLEHITDGDYTTPTCASCWVKMLLRARHSDKPYWACKNWMPNGKGCLTKIYLPHTHEAR